MMLGFFSQFSQYISQLRDFVLLEVNGKRSRLSFFISVTKFPNLTYNSEPLNSDSREAECQFCQN